MSGIPKEGYTLDVAREIREVFGGLHAVEIREYCRLELCFFRLQISLDMIRPLRWVIVLKLPHYRDVRAMIRYERSSKFYQQYGVLNHTVRNCPTIIGEFTYD